MAGDAVAGLVAEAVLEELRDEVLGVGESGDAVADVAGRDDVEVAAQLAAGAAVVGDGDDGGEVAGVALEAAQQRREAVAAADGDDLGAAVLGALRPDAVDEVLAAVEGMTAPTIERLSFQAAMTVTTVAVEMKSRPRTQRGRNCRVAVPTQSGKA